MKSFNKLVLPLLLLAHVLIRFGYAEDHMEFEQSPEELICSFEEQLHAPIYLDEPEAVLAIVE